MIGEYAKMRQASEPQEWSNVETEAVTDHRQLVATRRCPFGKADEARRHRIAAENVIEHLTPGCGEHRRLRVDCRADRPPATGDLAVEPLPSLQPKTAQQLVRNV